MKKSIYNVYVVMDSQETCDRMKQLCIDNGLPIWSFKCGWEFDNTYVGSHQFGFWDNEDFFIGLDANKNYTQVTESEFIELLKTTKCQEQQL